MADPSYLPTFPTLVILHNPSDYLAEEQAQQGGVEAYANILAQFRATFAQQAQTSSQTTKPPIVILHDRAATELSVPLLAPHHRPPKKPRLTDRDEEAKRPEEDRVPLAQIIRLFFDQVAVAERGMSLRLRLVPSQLKAQLTESRLDSFFSCCRPSCGLFSRRAAVQARVRPRRGRGGWQIGRVDCNRQSVRGGGRPHNH